VTKSRKTAWWYRGNAVRLARTARAYKHFTPGGKFSTYVQEALDNVEPWKEGDRRVASTTFDSKLFTPLAVRVARESPSIIWSVPAPGRNSKDVAPFIEFRPYFSTNTLTIKLIGTPKRPIITEIYGAEEEEPYTPPLPWKRSAADAIGGAQACLRYWQEHAYVLFSLKQIVPGAAFNRPPTWWFG
jgi:hypothetical protein